MPAPIFFPLNQLGVLRGIAVFSSLEEVLGVDRVKGQDSDYRAASSNLHGSP